LRNFPPRAAFLPALGSPRPVGFGPGWVTPVSYASRQDALRRDQGGARVLTRAWAYELADDRVRVNYIARLPESAGR